MNVLWEFYDALARPTLNDLVDDALAHIPRDARLIEGSLKERALAGEHDVTFLLLDTARVGKGKHRLAAMPSQPATVAMVPVGATAICAPLRIPWARMPSTTAVQSSAGRPNSCV